MRPVRIQTGIQRDPAGSVQIELGHTVVLCAAHVENSVPRWFDKDAASGWITAEYGMLPGAVPGRASRGAGGRAREIQRLIGRSLRASVDLALLGPRTITVDCDVIQADGGTRTASITAGFIAVHLAISRLLAAGALERSPVRTPVVAVACAQVDGRAVLDPCYEEDSRADVDMNFALGADGRFVEIQGTAEGLAFSQDQLLRMLELALGGARSLTAVQQAHLL